MLVRLGLCYDDTNIVQKCCWDVVANVAADAINIGKDVAIIDGVVSAIADGVDAAMAHGVAITITDGVA